MTSTVHHIRGPQNPLDRLARPLHDLRISVMDRCNFRCPYCMPKEQFHEHYRFLKSQERLSFEEIVRLSRMFASLGVRKLRLTGGEPLLRFQESIVFVKLLFGHAVRTAKIAAVHDRDAQIVQWPTEAIERVSQRTNG